MIGLVDLLFGNISHFSHLLVCTIRWLYIIRNYKWVSFYVFECVQCINTKRLNHTIRCFKDKIFFSLNLVIVDQLRASSDQKQIPSRASASVQTHIGGEFWNAWICSRAEVRVRSLLLWYILLWVRGFGSRRGNTVNSWAPPNAPPVTVALALRYDVKGSARLVVLALRLPEWATVVCSKREWW